MHRDYLEMYTTTVPQAVIQHIDKSRNCEDIAMQFVVSNVTDKPSVWVDGRYTDSGALDGISTTGIVQHRKVWAENVWLISVNQYMTTIMECYWFWEDVTVPA